MNLSEQILIEKLFGGEYLWKHRPDDSKNSYSIQELEKGYIYFSNPKEFNDPYDCFYGLVKPTCNEKN